MVATHEHSMSSSSSRSMYGSVLLAILSWLPVHERYVYMVPPDFCVIFSGLWGVIGLEFNCFGHSYSCSW